MKINLFGYYGVLVPISEVSAFMTKSGYKDIYTFIMKNELDYRNVGNMYNGHKIIIGKEIIWDYDFNAFKIKIDDGTIKFQSNIEEDHPLLTSADELIIKTKLAQVGVYGKPDYYVFTNYGS